MHSYGITSHSPGYRHWYTDSVTGSWSFTYDRLNRLVAGMPASGNPLNGGNNLCWSYDPFGNRTTQTSQSAACPTLPSVPSPTVTYNANNQVTGGQLGYDAAGEVTTDTSTGNTYLYDVSVWSRPCGRFECAGRRWLYGSAHRCGFGDGCRPG